MLYYKYLSDISPRKKAFVMIPFNVPPCVGDELDYVKQAIDSHKICGDGAFTKQCNAWLEERFHAQKVLLTTR